MTIYQQSSVINISFALLTNKTVNLLANVPPRAPPTPVCTQAVRSFEVAVHLQPSELSLWRDDLAWARRLQQQRQAAAEQPQREEETRQRIPELQRDYDFESDEVLVACEAVARRQTHLQEPRRSAVVVDARGNVREVALEGSAEELELAVGDAGLDAASKEQFVKARGL